MFQILISKPNALSSYCLESQFSAKGGCAHVYNDILFTLSNFVLHGYPIFNQITIKKFLFCLSPNSSDYYTYLGHIISKIEHALPIFPFFEIIILGDVSFSFSESFQLIENGGYKTTDLFIATIPLRRAEKAWFFLVTQKLTPFNYLLDIIFLGVPTSSKTNKQINPSSIFNVHDLFSWYIFGRFIYSFH